MITRVATPCPSAASLAMYLLGTLDDDGFESIDRHVSTCDGCQSSISEMPDAADSLDDCLKALDDSLDATTDSDSRSVNAYQLIGKLGRGGMGEVHRATHRFFGHEAAVKILIRSGPARGRFLQEMRIARAVQHPNVVRIEDAGETPDGRLYLAMELLEGENLSELVGRRGALPAPEACEIARQIAEGLGAAHAIGVVHRDVKPANVMLSPNGIVKLLDLGLCRRFEGVDAADALTHEGQLLGTPDFMAPEQARDPRRVDARGDLYALGCTLYFLLTGRKPFEGPDHTTLPAKIIAHASEECTPVDKLRGDLPRGLPNLVRRLMAKSPSDRPESSAAVAAALTPFTVGADLRKLASQGAATPAKPLDDPTIVRRSHRWLSWVRLLAAVAVTAVAVSGAYVAVFDQPPPSPPVNPPVVLPDVPKPAPSPKPNIDNPDANGLPNTVSSFLAASPLPVPLRTAMKDAVTTTPNRKSWAGELDSTAFAIAVQEKPSQRAEGLAEASLQNIAAAKAARELILAAAAREEFGKKHGLTDLELLRTALDSTGWEFAGTVVGMQRQVGVKEKAAIAWITAPKANIAAMLTKPTHLASIRKAYAAAGMTRINSDAAARRWAEVLRTADHLAACSASTLESELAGCGALLELARDEDAVARLATTKSRLSGTSNAKLLEMVGDHAWTIRERQVGTNKTLAATAEKLAREAWKAATTIEQGKPAP